LAIRIGDRYFKAGFHKGRVAGHYWADPHTLPRIEYSAAKIHFPIEAGGRINFASALTFKDIPGTNSGTMAARRGR